MEQEKIKKLLEYQEKESLKEKLLKNRFIKEKNK